MLLNVQGWFLFTLISCVVCQIVPKIPCPEFFEYVFVKDHFQGKLTFPKPSSTGIEVEVELSQEGPLENGYSGYIALNKTEVDILNGDPVIYQITFPSSNEVPKLNSIRVNNKTICSGLEFYSFDKQKLKLLHKTILNSPVPSNKNDFSDITSDHRKKPKDLETTQIPQEKLKRLLESTEIQQEKQKGLLSFLDFLPIIGVSKFIPRIRSSIRTAIEERGKEVAIMAEFSTKDHCGYQHTELTPFVNGGRPIDRAQMPWIAAIYQKADTGLEFLCSGSLLSSLTVITAAHCVANRFKFSADRLVVYLGKHNLSDYSEQGFEAREVKTYLVHPEYKVRNLSDADIALLIFHDRINFSDYITPICLWNSAFTLAKSKENRVGFIAGWGANEDGQTLSNIPKMVEAKIYSSEECSAFPGYKQVSTPRTLCAGNMDGTGPCIGDSGAGLIIKDDGRWFIRAVVSGGLKTEKVCGRQQFVVYCDLAKHTKWILRNLIEEATGRIALNQSEVEIIDGNPVVYQILFPDQDEVPKLLKIIVNNDIICSALQHYSTYSSNNFKMSHKFSLNVPEVDENRMRTQVPFISSRRSELQELLSPNQNSPDKRKVEPTIIVITDNDNNEQILDLFKTSKRTIVVEPRSLSSEAFTNIPESTESSIYFTPTLSKNKHSCGKSTIWKKNLTIEETNVKRGEQPWLAAVYQNMQAEVEFLCGGFLISTLSILTSATCLINQQIFNADRLVVYMGSSDCDDYKEPGYQIKNVKTFIVHPEFTTWKLSDANLAILILESTVSITDYIIPVCLWQRTYNSNIPQNGENAVLVGWATNNIKSLKAIIPKIIRRKIFSNQKCLEIIGKRQDLAARTLCSGGMNSTNPCLSDAMAGLLFYLDDQWILRGITSLNPTSNKFCSYEELIVYTDLAKHIDWIARNIME